MFAIVTTTTTTTTVAILSAGAVLGLAGLLTLVVLLVLKEAAGVHDSRRLRRAALALNVGIIPLLGVLAAIIGTQVVGALT